MAAGIERVKSGIKGFDELVGGGLPKNSIVLVSGSAGAGKTIFALQFLVEGARKGEKGLFVNFDETREELYQQGDMFGWDLEGLERKGLLKIVNFDITKTHVVNVLVDMESAVRQFKPLRFALDSISILSIYSEVSAGVELLEMMGIRSDRAIPMGEVIQRGAVMSIIRKIHEFKCTALVVSELPEETHWLSRDTVSEFVCDGIVLLSYFGLGKAESRTIMIRKMRGTNHEKDAVPCEIGSKGFVIKKAADVYK